MLFAATLLRTLCFDEMRKSRTGYRTIGELTNTNFIMANTFYIGVYPGIGAKQIEQMIARLREYFLFDS